MSSSRSNSAVKPKNFKRGQHTPVDSDNDEDFMGDNIKKNMHPSKDSEEEKKLIRSLAARKGAETKKRKLLEE